MRFRILQKAYTGSALVKITIIIVVIGLSVGSVLKGQAMIENTNIERVMKQTDEIRAAVMAFYDKYGQYPGDENIVNLPIDDTIEGNGNDQISANEDNDLFHDLQLANLISGSYSGADLPYHSFGDTITLYWTDPLGRGAEHWFLLKNIPAEIRQELDSKYDDGDPTAGSIVNDGGAAYRPNTKITNFYILF